MMHIIKIDESNLRIVRGKLVNELTLDWSIKDLGELKRHLDFALGFEEDLPSLKKAKYKNLCIHEGANHIDIIDHNVGTLNLLSIEDHDVAK